MVATTDSTSEAPSGKPAGRLFPGLCVQIIVGLALAAVVVIRIWMRLEDPPRPFSDVAFGNLVSFSLACLAALTAWIWLSFFSGYAPLMKLLVRLAGAVPLIVFAPFVGLLRLEGFDGDMRPTFVPRWWQRHDRALAPVEPPAAVKTVDLKSTTADDFPQFLGPQRSCWVPEPQLARDWNAVPPQLLWRRPIGAGWSAFAAVNGYAVTQEQRGDSELITCYEIATGTPVWAHGVTGRHENAMGGIGPRATPTIHQGRVYAVGATGQVHCLDGATGKPLWHDDLLQRYGNLEQAQFEAQVQWGRAGSPLIVDRLVVVPAGGPEGDAKNLVAYDAETGEVVWESTCPRKLGGTDQIAYSSPALATVAGVRQILIVNESTASGHEPETGKCLWSYEWPGHSNADASSSQAVAIGADQVLLSKGYTVGAELIRLTPGAAWQAQSVWKNPRALQTKFTNVVVYGGYAYGLSEGILQCADLADGKSRWRNSRGRYGNGQILGVGDLLLVLAEDGRLVLVELNPEKFTELGSIQALEGVTWNNLCLYGHRLLIRNGTEAACYELP